MLSKIEVRNFQSIEHLDIELGPLTVLVGQSNVGKSAFTRAIRMLTSNARGTSFIRHGQQVCTVSATLDRGTVTLKKGKGSDEYITVPSDPDSPQRTYTKLGGAVPEEVTEFIGIAPKDAINYAGQFDRPYMLADTGGDVARALGGLTGVNVVFEGASESRKRQLRSAATLRDRQGTLTDTMGKIDDYRPLKGWSAALKRAEEALETVQGAARRLEDLTDAVDDYEAAQRTLANVDPLADADLPTEDLRRALAAGSRIRLLDSHLATLRSAKVTQRKAEEALAVATEDIIVAQQQYIDLLTEAGTCPTCGQSTTHLHLEAIA